jgi:hypothetical protein
MRDLNATHPAPRWRDWEVRACLVGLPVILAGIGRRSEELGLQDQTV